MYKKKTNHYSIPYISKGEMLEGIAEETAAQIIDNMLYAATFGLSKGVFKDGTYSVNKDEDGTYTLSVSPVDGYSFIGLLNYRLFSSKQIKKISGLQTGNKYYIYVCWSNGLEQNPELFTFMSTTETPSEIELNVLNHSQTLLIYVADVDLTGIEPKINTEPYSNKYVITSIFDHIKNNANPHGKSLTQNELMVVEKLSLQGYVVHPCEYRELTFEENTTDYTLDFDGKINFVSYMDLSEPQKIWFEISEKVLTVHTEGKIGTIKIRAELE